MPNETIQKFGYPKNVVAEYDHWVVLLRGMQSTLGSLILACNEDAESLPAVSPAAYAQLPAVTAALERALHEAFGFDKINYLLLMMVDKHVHFHVLPRYSTPRTFEGVEFKDPGWPRAPALGEATQVPDDTFEKLRAHLAGVWKK